jgi:hypothetical protein
VNSKENQTKRKKRRKFKKEENVKNDFENKEESDERTNSFVSAQGYSTLALLGTCRLLSLLLLEFICFFLLFGEMASADPAAALTAAQIEQQQSEAAIEQWKIKKLIKSLEAARGFAFRFLSTRFHPSVLLPSLFSCFSLSLTLSCSIF